MKTESPLANERSTAGVLTPESDDDLLVLLGGFKDTSPTYSASDFEEAFFGDGSNVDGPGTLRDYYLEATDGKISLNSGPAGVSGWYETDMTSDQIGEEDGDFLDLTPNENSQFVRKVIEQADSDVDFSEYDNDDDGCIAVMVVYQGVNIRAHASSPWGNFFKDADFSVDADGVTVSAYARVQEKQTDGDGNPTGDRNTIGTPAHELGHLYGLPDLYKEDGGPNDDIGLWGLMASGNFGTQGGLTGSSPTHLSAWTKLYLLQAPSPRRTIIDDYRITIPQQGQPGILPPAATYDQYYRIESDDPGVRSCSFCDEPYFLVAYRKQVGFDQGLSATTPGRTDSLRISRVNAPWDGTLDNDPNLIEGTNRFGRYGTQPFNADNDDLARYADGTDSGVDLREFKKEYGMATFNDPPEKQLDADETRVLAIGVNQTLPNGTKTSDEWRIDHRIATNTSAEFSLFMRKASQTGVGFETAESTEFLRVSTSQSGLFDQFGTEDQQRELSEEQKERREDLKEFFGDEDTTNNDGRISNEGFRRTRPDNGAKIIVETNQSTEYIAATTYPTFELPSNMTGEVTEPWQDFEGQESNVTVEVDIRASGDAYDYGQWGTPEDVQFDVEIGEAAVASENFTVTELDTHRYEIEAPVPVRRMKGYDVNVSYTGRKAGARHTVYASGNVLEPVLQEMDGDGSATDPYGITEAPELQAIDAAPDAHFELQDNIDASATRNWFQPGERLAKGFIPIGDGTESPDGVNITFDGNGHTISGLLINRKDQASVGLFGAIGPAGTVRDLRMTNATVDGGGLDGGVGTIAARNRGTIENVTVENTEVDEWADSNTPAGGIVSVNGIESDDPGTELGTIRNASFGGSVQAGGEAGGIAAINGAGEIRDSSSSAEINGGRGTGGLVGSNTGLVERSYATGEVVGDRDTGGLVGRNYYIVRRSYATGAVTSPGAQTGGLVGTLETVSNYDDTEVAVIEESFATGHVDGSTRAGGLVGENNFGNVTASYARGDVEGDDRVAGLVGANNEGGDGGFVMQSYATGTLTGNRFVEGLVYNNGGVAVGSYFMKGSVNGDLTPREEQRALAPSEMRGGSATEHMAGFDFENTWTVVDGDYPQLRWYSEQQPDSDGNDGDSENGDTTDRDGASGDADTEGSTSGSDDATGSSGPGMGVLVAVTGLLVVALLLARRTGD